MPANKAQRLQIMYSDYQSGKTLEAVADDFHMDVTVMVAEFRQRGYELLPADRERFPVIAAPRRGRPPRKGEDGTPRERGKPGRKPRYTPDIVQLMYARYEEGKTLAEIAKEFGASPATVGNLFKRAALGIRRRGTRLWPEEYARELHARYEAGEALATIAADQDMTVAQVRKCLRQHGFDVKKSTAKAVPLVKDESFVRALYGRFEAGEELEEIAESAELTVPQIKRMFMLHHLPLRRLSPVIPMKRPAPEPQAAPDSTPAGPAPLLEAPDDPVEREHLARQMYALFEEGHSLPDIAVLFRSSAGLVQQLFAEYGFAMTRGTPGGGSGFRKRGGWGGDRW